MNSPEAEFERLYELIGPPICVQDPEIWMGLLAIRDGQRSTEQGLIAIIQMLHKSKYLAEDALLVERLRRTG